MGTFFSFTECCCFVRWCHLFNYGCSCWHFNVWYGKYYFIYRKYFVFSYGKKQVLADVVYCHYCSQWMSISSRSNLSDKYIWFCNVCRTRVTVRSKRFWFNQISSIKIQLMSKTRQAKHIHINWRNLYLYFSNISFESKKMATKINSDGVKTRLFLFLTPMYRRGNVDGAACTYRNGTIQQCKMILWKYSIQSLRTVGLVLLTLFMRDNAGCDIPHATKPRVERYYVPK